MPVYTVRCHHIVVNFLQNLTIDTLQFTPEGEVWVFVESLIYILLRPLQCRNTIINWTVLWLHSPVSKMLTDYKH